MSGEVLPTMISGVDDDDPIELDEIVEAALSDDAARMLAESGWSVSDVLAGKVPGLDPVEIIVGVWTEMLPEDEYARCMARLPDLLAEYERSVE